jgi:hypothetical protein
MALFPSATFQVKNGSSITIWTSKNSASQPSPPTLVQVPSIPRLAFRKKDARN